MTSWEIIKITPQRKNKSRVNLYFSDFVLGTSLYLLTKFNLKAGEIVSEKKLLNLWEKEITERTTNKALLLLSYRPQSEKEMEQKLKRYIYKSEPGFRKTPLFIQLKSSRVIKKVILNLKRKKLLGDKNFASWWLEQRSTYRPRSPYPRQLSSNNNTYQRNNRVHPCHLSHYFGY